MRTPAPGRVVPRPAAPKPPRPDLEADLGTGVVKVMESDLGTGAVKVMASDQGAGAVKRRADDSNVAASAAMFEVKPKLAAHFL